MLCIELNEVYGKTIKINCNKNIPVLSDNNMLNFRDDSNSYDIEVILDDDVISLKIIDETMYNVNNGKYNCGQKNSDAQVYEKIYKYVLE